MSRPMQITLRAGDRVYINGAVVRAQRKVTLELLNDVNFLLDSHVIQADDTSTPLRQLYFVLQAVLIDPQNAPSTRRLFDVVLESTLSTFTNDTVLDGLKQVQANVEDNKVFEGLKTLRTLFAIETTILSADDADAALAAKPAIAGTDDNAQAA